METTEMCVPRVFISTWLTHWKDLLKAGNWGKCYQLDVGNIMKEEGKINKILEFFFFPFFLLFMATSVAYGDSQARGQIRATTAGLHHSHSNARSKPRLQPTPQLTATPDRLTH